VTDFTSEPLFKDLLDGLHGLHGLDGSLVKGVFAGPPTTEGAEGAEGAEEGGARGEIAMGGKGVGGGGEDNSDDSGTSIHSLHPIRLVAGLPVVTTDLRVCKGINVYVTGNYAALEIGPGALRGAG
jgi:hypothetical protein